MLTIRRAIPLLLTTALGGCATLFNPGGVGKLPRDASAAQNNSQVKAAPLEIYNIPGDAMVYDNDVRFDVTAVRANARIAPRRECLETLDIIRRTAGSTASGERDRQRLIAAFNQRFPAECDFSHAPWGVKLMLAHGVDHRLRFVDGTREATFNVKTHMHLRWIWFNGFLGPAFPLGLVVDAATGKWSYFSGPLDVSKEMAAKRTAAN